MRGWWQRPWWHWWQPRHRWQGWLAVQTLDRSPSRHAPCFPANKVVTPAWTARVCNRLRPRRHCDCSRPKACSTGFGLCTVPVVRPELSCFAGGGHFAVHAPKRTIALPRVAPRGTSCPRHGHTKQQHNKGWHRRKVPWRTSSARSSVRVGGNFSDFSSCRGDI